jgi:hypothetical protein
VEFISRLRRIGGTAMPDYRPRLSIELTHQQAEDLRRLIPWGLKNQLFSILIDDIIRLGRSHGQKFLAAVLAREIKLEDWSEGLSQEGE